jgi:nitrous oxidase accessory protein NosD
MLHRIHVAVALTLALAGPTQARKLAAAAPACPEGTVSLGTICTLPEDELVLTRTLDLGSGVHLDCRGRRIVPGAPAPLLAVIIRDAVDAKITSCHIEGFEQGIYVVRTVGRNWINDNVIDARVKGITLLGADDTRVEGNRITVASNFGAGIGVWRASSRNLIRGNQVVSLGGPPGEPPATDFPGPPVSYSPPEAAPAVGIIVGSSGLDNPIVQFVFDGELYQLPIVADEFGVEDNVIEGNTVTATGVTGIMLSSRNLRTLVRGNTVSAAGDAARRSRGIVVGPGTKAQTIVPSKCALQPGRACVADLDCNGRLPDDPPEDACVTGPTQREVDFTSHEVVVEGNTVGGGGLSTGIDAGAATMRVTGNRVSGAATAGISLGRVALGDAWVAGNVLADNTIGLNLAAAVAATSLVFTHNDVVRSGTPVQAPATWNVLLELSLDGEGNHWGLGCPDAFPGASSPMITDSFPYGAPVADPAGDPPVPCGD